MPATVMSKLHDAQGQSIMERLDGPLAWSSDEYTDASSYTLNLTGDDLVAIDQALKTCQGTETVS